MLVRLGGGGLEQSLYHGLSGDAGISVRGYVRRRRLKGGLRRDSRRTFDMEETGMQTVGVTQWPFPQIHISGGRDGCRGMGVEAVRWQSDFYLAALDFKEDTRGQPHL